MGVLNSFQHALVAVILTDPCSCPYVLMSRTCLWLCLTAGRVALSIQLSMRHASGVQHGVQAVYDAKSEEIGPGIYRFKAEIGKLLCSVPTTASLPLVLLSLRHPSSCVHMSGRHCSHITLDAFTSNVSFCLMDSLL